MTDNTLGVQPNYEQLRDSATGEAGEVWRQADREESNLRTFYANLKEDPRYTEQHKGEKAWERYEAAKEKIAEGKTRTKELLEKQVLSAERLSLPFPDGEGLITTDTNKLLASQNEAARIVRKLDRLDSSSAGPLKPDKTKALKEEYWRGLEVGSVQGGAICRGVLEAADELGVDKHAIVDGFRKQRHHDSLERAQHALRLTQLISRSVPEPPFPRPAANRPGSSGKLFVPRERGQMFKRSKPSWK